MPTASPPVIGGLAQTAGASVIDGKTRGFPPATDPLALSEIADKGWSVPNEDLSFPLLTLCLPAFTSNLAVINAWGTEHGVRLCPHGKTMMAPQLFQTVLAGAATVGLTAATVPQATVMAESGARVVLVANEIVGRANVRRFAELIGAFPATRFLSLIDSPAALDLLLDGETDLPPGKVFEVLVEVGAEGGRTGVRTPAALVDLLDAIRRKIEAGAPLILGGVEGYEGAVPGTGDAWLANTHAYFAFLRDAYRSVVASHLIPADRVPVLSAGGSGTFDIAAKELSGVAFDRVPEIWLRPGVVATFDHVVYRKRLADMDVRGGFVLGGKTVSAVAAFQPALALWAVVQSTPEPGLAIVTAGIRDFPIDSGYPVALAQYRRGNLVAAFSAPWPAIVKSNDQHAFFPVPANADVRVGDVIKFGISHPCTTFDRWQVIFCVDTDERVIGAVRTYF